MEDIDKSIKKILSFVCIVQNSCDSHKQMLELTFKKEYSKFVERWKKRKAEMEQAVAEANALKAASVEEAKDNIELEEILQANLLLDKAKRLRGKFQHLYQTPMATGSAIKIKGSIDQKTCGQNARVPILLDNGINIKKSVSEPVLGQVRKKKSANNGSKTLRNSNSHNTESSLPVKSETRSASSVSVVSKSSSQFSEKTAEDSKNNKAEVPQNRCNKSKATHSISNKDARKTDSNGDFVKKRPTIRDFREELKKDKLVESSSFSPCIFKCSWYPFINTANERKLALHLTCNNYKELTKAYTLLHKIQEALYWLDLFCLLGAEMAILQHSDKNFTLAFSWMRSIFHEQLQRTPIILPPD